MSQENEIKCGNVHARIAYYPGGGGIRKGWHIDYVGRDRDGYDDQLDDSAKVGHPELPKRVDAGKKVARIAKSYACKLSRRDSR